MHQGETGSTHIHPTAQIGPKVQLGPGCEIGPGCIITGEVKLGAGVRVVGPAWIGGECGPTVIGNATEIHPYACIGAPGQDIKFKRGDRSAGVVIGDQCIIRENVTIHAATKMEAPTTLGDRVFMMACSHVGHDGRVGDGAVLVNNSCVGGHGQVGANATMGGGALLHQFTRIGRLSFLAGGARQTTDVPPFCMAVERNQLSGINVVGLRRNGFSRAEITVVREIFRLALRRTLHREELTAMFAEGARTSPAIAEMSRFIADAKRPICGGSGKPPRQMLAWLRWMTSGGRSEELVEEAVD